MLRFSFQTDSICATMTPNPLSLAPSARTLVVFNPIAGGRDNRFFLPLLKKMAEKYNFEYELYQTTGEDDLAQIRARIESFAPERVLSAGGDGTLYLVAEIARHTPLVVGVVPLGSANGMARDLNLPTEVAAALEISLTSKVVAADLVRINGRHHCLHLSDLGFNAKIIKGYLEEKKRGMRSYAKQFFRQYFSKRGRGRKFLITTDQSRVELHQRAIMVAFANGSRYGTGANLNPEGSFYDGAFELCIVRPIPFYAFLATLIRGFSGTLNRSRYITIIRCKKARVRLEKPIWLQIDGELIGKVQEVEAEMVPACLRLVVNEP